jgi:cell division protein FtsI/penicillin-binding protein 2
MYPVNARLKWHRILWLIICFASLFAVLLGRLFVLMIFPAFAGPQVHGKRQWTVQRSHADLEHFHSSLVNDGRGKILYRSGAPIMLTHNLQQVIGIVGKPDEWPRAGVEVPVAGRSGLQYTFDAMLQGRHAGYTGKLERASQDTRYFTVRAKAGANVRTTVEYAWQDICEKALSDSHVREGAIVVLDVRTNEILAMASRSSQPLTNDAVLPFVPGSIFKLVVAAAALETHRISRSIHFVCVGRIDTPEIHMACWRTHGHESLRDSIVQSCDTAFANIGVMLGRSPVEVMFHQLGLDTGGIQETAGRTVLPEAKAGQVFRQSGVDKGLLANTAIGQEDVRMSPLQGALLASAVANNGLVRPATMVLDAEQNGKMVRSFQDGMRFHSAFSSATAAFLGSAMNGVAADKNGTFYDLHELPIAVKTGTAELPGKLVNAWVIGYMHKDHPDIAFAVLSAHVSSSSGHRQVRQIVRELADLYMQIHHDSLIR